MEQPQQQPKPKGKNSLKKGIDRQTGKKEPYAYVIKDAVFGEFKVLNTANAWWADASKVRRLIDAYKIDCTDAEACIYAGILYKTLGYFQTLHPEFLGIKAACKELPCLVARQTINTALKNNAGDAWKYLERKRKHEFGPNIDVTSGGEKLPASSNQIEFVNFSVKEEENATSQ